MYRGTDKFLARPTSRCRRTELIVSLERGSVHVPNRKSFLVTEAERKHAGRRASLVAVACFLPGQAKTYHHPCNNRLLR
jgi:hypothetical protein